MKIISNFLIFIGLLILLLTFGRPFWEEMKFRSQKTVGIKYQVLEKVPVTAGTVAGVQTVVDGAAGGVAGGSGEVSILPVEETPAAGEGELGGGVSTEGGEVQGESTEKTSGLPFIVGGFSLLLIAAASYFYWKRNKV